MEDDRSNISASGIKKVTLCFKSKHFYRKDDVHFLYLENPISPFHEKNATAAATIAHRFKFIRPGKKYLP